MINKKISTLLVLGMILLVAVAQGCSPFCTGGAVVYCANNRNQKTGEAVCSRSGNDWVVGCGASGGSPQSCETNGGRGGQPYCKGC
ncbi:hypothetical protein DFH28DRAFT_975898 [Melampsora americana]|nr:hypothetical protein DFH28DRAFT_975898 [Melampsora americana]